MAAVANLKHLLSPGVRFDGHTLLLLGCDVIAPAATLPADPRTSATSTPIPRDTSPTMPVALTPDEFIANC